jgi:hypothetical protein
LLCALLPKRVLIYIITIALTMYTLFLICSILHLVYTNVGISVGIGVYIATVGIILIIIATPFHNRSCIKTVDS